MPPITLESIRAARDRIGDAIYHSPCPYSLSLSRLCGCSIYCKLDHLQMTGSFKERGARNKLLLLTAAAHAAGQKEPGGVVAASAGNHALGLAYHGQLLGIPVAVVMPRWAPLVKVSNCRSFGAEIILHGETFDDARQHALELASRRKLSFIPAFDDPDIMAGQGTLGLEILEDLPDVDAIICPVGGGGLISGIATAAKALRPGVRIIGVEAEYAPTMHASLAAGKVRRVPTRPTLADGLAVAEVGQLCFEVARQLVEQVVLVSEVDIAKAILRLLELEKMVIEGAGATGLAAALTHGQRLQLAGKKVVLVLCGGNIDVTMISRIIERGMAADGRLARLTIDIPDRPGYLARALSLLAEHGANVKQVEHDRHFGPADVALVSVSVLMETRDAAHIQEIRAALQEAGMTFD
jgi:threonine dehydratase